MAHTYLYTAERVKVVKHCFTLLLLLLLLLLSWRARQALPIWGDRCPEEMRNSTRLWIRRDPSLPRGSWQPFINWSTNQGRLSLPTADVLSTIVKQSMLTDVDKMSSCSRFSDSVVGFTGQKTQPTAPKYWRSNCHFTLITGYLSGLYHYWLWNRKNIWIVLSGL